MRFLQGHAALFSLLATTAMTFPTTSAFAQDVTWIGGDDFWHNPFWDNGGTPGASDHAIINDGHVTVDLAGAEALDVTVTNTGILEFQNQTADSLLINLFDLDTSEIPELRFTLGGSAGNSTLNVTGNDNGTSTDVSVTFFDTSSAGTADITLSNNAQLVFTNDSRGGSATVSSDASDIRFENDASAENAHITSTAGSTIVFADNATADDATIDLLNQGTGTPQLDFYNAASAGTATVSVTGNGSGTYIDATVTFRDGSSAGDAAITLSNSAQMVFRDNSTAGDATIVSTDSMVGFQDDASAGSAEITNNSGSILIFALNATADGATVINNAGGVVDVYFRTGGAPIGIGSLSGAGNVYLGAAGVALGALNQNDTISGMIGDGYSPELRAALGITGPQPTGGILEKVGTGTLTLTGNNTFIGDTLISAGILQLGNGGTSGSLAGNIENHGTLAVNRSDTVTYNSVISGGGAVRLIGSGGVALTGDSSGFTGTTAVEAGTLAVNGSLGGDLDIWSAAKLQGTGTVGNTNISGTIAPGNSIGTLMVNGNITFQAGSTYAVEADAAGQSDKIHATGTAAINGGTVSVTAGAGDYQADTQYTILTADAGRNGTFATLLSDLAFLDASLSYDPQNVFLTLMRNNVDFGSVGETPNEVETGHGVQSTGAGNPVYESVVDLSAAQARAAFDALSGEIHASGVSALLEDSRFIRDAMNNRLLASFAPVPIEVLPVLAYSEPAGGGMMAPSSADNSYGVWGSAFGSWASSDGDGNAAGMSRNVGGFLAGIDGLVAESWKLGLLTGYSRSSFDVDDRQSSATSDSYHVGVYGGTQWGQLSLRSGAAYSWNDIDADRQVVFGGVNDQLTSSYGAGTTQVFGELGYGMTAGSLALEPFVNLAYVNVHTDGFVEQGGASALSVNGTSNSLTFSTLGLRASTDLMFGDMPASVRGMIGWRHAYGDVAPTLGQAFAGGDVFSIAGVPVTKDAAVFEAGLDLEIAPNAGLGLTYQGQIGKDAQDHAIKAASNVKF